MVNGSLIAIPMVTLKAWKYVLQPPQLEGMIVFPSRGLLLHHSQSIILINIH